MINTKFENVEITYSSYNPSLNTKNMSANPLVRIDTLKSLIKQDAIISDREFDGVVMFIIGEMILKIDNRKHLNDMFEFIFFQQLNVFIQASGTNKFFIHHVPSYNDSLIMEQVNSILEQ